MTITQYIDNISKRYKQGNATEHTFRGDLQQLIESICPNIQATNEPKRQQCGAPDYILTKKDIPVGFIEAKDIGDKDLDGLKKTGNKEQFDRYKASLNNLLFTDYLHFHLYIDGQFVTKVAIAELVPLSGVKDPDFFGREGLGVRSLPQNFDSFTNLLQNFCIHIGQTIKSSKRLAEMMAGKAKLLAEIIEKALTSDEDLHENSTLKEQMQAFRQILIHNITPKGFADVYAQTIAYGMFAARLHDPTLPTFSRQEAAELIPKSNPFLRKLFGYIAGPDLDDRIKWIVDGLVEVFLACNVEELLKNYGKSTKTENPIIHFYETFLSEYDAALRKARGVWYTPHPVVNFQVRAIDEILKTEFGLPMGIADSSKIKIKTDVQGKAVEQEVHRVQMLDPATGTGTYIAEVITLIHKKFEGQQGIWSNYVENQLLPRLIGFELLMASYAMAHLQIDLLLTETGYKPTRDQRLKIFLTNSLEESHPDTGTLFANWLSTEANEANRIKRDCPVMVVMGNPPYSVSSTNKGKWIESLTADYKKDLNERNIQPLSDDYIKFIRFGQHFIDKNGSGILAYISNNSFIDGIIHRQMRKNLLECFDKIYILNLHGNAKKKEVALDGGVDENVFDIMQGVSINLFIKTGKKKKLELGDLFYQSVQGKRISKYNLLLENSLSTIKWNKLNTSSSNYFFIDKNFKGNDDYVNGFKIDNLFLEFSGGIQTKRDKLFLDYNSIELKKRITKLLSGEIDQNYITQYKIENSSSYFLLDKIKKVKYNSNSVRQINYFPFDSPFIYYDKDLIGRPFYKNMSHLLNEKNLGLVVPKQNKETGCGFITNKIIGQKLFSAYDINYAFPLYLYPETTTQQTFETQPERVPNFNEAIIEKIAQSINHVMVEEGVVVDVAAGCDGTFTPLDVLDYIYAVLHSPAYRDKYKEFLKIDFPRVPYPTNAASFWQLVALGGQLRQLHLLESQEVEQYITQYPINGDNKVTKPHYTDGKVYINDTQYFDKVPELAWNFYIGGYQPAQKWLKDRKERTLEFEDILHYQKIIVALAETDKLMKEIDAVGVEW